MRDKKRSRPGVFPSTTWMAHVTRNEATILRELPARMEAARFEVHQGTTLVSCGACPDCQVHVPGSSMLRGSDWALVNALGGSREWPSATVLRVGSWVVDRVPATAFCAYWYNEWATHVLMAAAIGPCAGRVTYQAVLDAADTLCLAGVPTVRRELPPKSSFPDGYWELFTDAGLTRDGRVPPEHELAAMDLLDRRDGLVRRDIRRVK